MATKSPGAAAAPAPTSPTTADSDNEVGAEVMRAVGTRFGVNLPAEPLPAVLETPEEDEGDTAETPEIPVAGEAETPAEGETPAAAEEEETPPAPTAEETEAQTTAAETAKHVATALKSLPEATRKVVQTVIDKRIGQVVAKERAKTDEATARIAALETELAEAQAATPAAPAPAVAGTHPLMLAKNESELDRRVAEIDAAEEFFIRHEDGYDGDGTDANPPISAADLKLRWRELSRERDRIIPAARKLLQERATHEAELRKTAPTFLDAKSEDGRAVQATLKLMPELRRHANATALAVQIVLGQRALAALTAKTATTKPATAPKKAPRVPGAGGPAKGGAPVTDGRPDSSAAVKTLMQRPGDRNAFNAAVASLVA